MIKIITKSYGNITFNDPDINFRNVKVKDGFLIVTMDETRWNDAIAMINVNDIICVFDDKSNINGSNIYSPRDA